MCGSVDAVGLVDAAAAAAPPARTLASSCALPGKRAGPIYVARSFGMRCEQAAAYSDINDNELSESYENRIERHSKCGAIAQRA